MKRFLGIVGYEYRMSIQRWGFWIAFGLVFALYAFASADNPNQVKTIDMKAAWAMMGQAMFQLNLLFPVVAGISIADRVVRDRKLGVEEILLGTPLPRWAYVFGKYFGSLLSVLTPVTLLMLFLIGKPILTGAPLVALPIALVTFGAVVIPTYAFITAFSLACPLIMPVRVYQVLFTGYWFWGNYLTPRVMPTISETLLNASGKFACRGFFGGCAWQGGGTVGQTPLDASLNLLTLAACLAAALFTLERYLAWERARR